MRSKGSLDARLRKLEERPRPEGLEEVRRRVERDVEASRTPEGLARARKIRDEAFGFQVDEELEARQAASFGWHVADGREEQR